MIKKKLHDVLKKKIVSYIHTNDIIKITLYYLLLLSNTVFH